jgi:ribonuclease BN (tRNA processing enzyme)
VRLTVLGGTGAWPEAHGACSGYLVEQAGHVCLIDPGYAVLPILQELMPVDAVDAVIVTHGHPDHCVDLNPLLRARSLRDDPAPALPVFAPAGALDVVLSLDRPGMLDHAYELTDLQSGGSVRIGPWTVACRSLPHFKPNLGVRLESGGLALAYTGDAGPSPDAVPLARDVDLLLAESSFADRVPDDSVGALSSAADAGRLAAESGAQRLVLTHLMPGTDAEAAKRAAAEIYPGPIMVARRGLLVEL